MQRYHNGRRLSSRRNLSVNRADWFGKSHDGGRKNVKKKLYTIQLWDDRLGWVMVSHGNRPMVYFRKKDANADIDKMRRNASGRMRYEARPFEAV